MKTIVLDDDPTGTQSASGVTVLLESNVDLLTEALRDNDSVYVQTNSRAIGEDAAVALIRTVRSDGLEAARRLGCDVRFVLRGDSTLRGHVFAESNVFATDDSIMVFVPAFPAGGRTTVNGVHLVTIDGVAVPADETEYAQDPVFGFRHGRLIEYVAEKSGRRGVHVPLEVVRTGGLDAVLLSAKAGDVIVPDVTDDNDIDAIATAIMNAITDAQGSRRTIVVRCAAPLAAALAGVTSSGLLTTPLVSEPKRTLLVCGSHTIGATRQLEPVISAWGEPALIDTAAALTNSAKAGPDAAAAAAASDQLDARGIAILTSERTRSSEHNTLEHGSRVMEALTTAVRAVIESVDVVIAKGGITSADVARIGIGARSARVLGQVLPGISVWDLTAADGHRVLYVVVPGNVGGPDTLTRVLAAVGYA